jgi:hypothetical protein
MSVALVRYEQNDDAVMKRMMLTDRETTVAR